MNKKQNFQDASAEALFRQFIRGWVAIERKLDFPSALKVEQDYAEYGIKLPFKNYYEYKAPSEFESLYEMLFWLGQSEGAKAMFADKWLLPFEEFWKWIKEIDVEIFNDFWKERLVFYKAFTKEQMEKIYAYVKQKRQMLNWNSIIADVKRLNPELAHIRTDGKRSNVMGVVPDFIRGVAYGFAPEDIDYCLNAPKDEWDEFQEIYKKVLCFYGHVPAPARFEALAVAETARLKVWKDKGWYRE